MLGKDGPRGFAHAFNLSGRCQGNAFQVVIKVAMISS
jgi:hypothetical protein